MINDIIEIGNKNIKSQPILNCQVFNATIFQNFKYAFSYHKVHI